MDEDWKVFSFLKKNDKQASLSSLPLLRAHPRGINVGKKKEILQTLGPLMKNFGKDKLKFWQELPTDHVADLAAESDGEQIDE